MKLTELLQRKSECIRLDQSGFTFEEASEVNQLIIEQLQTRIAELEKKSMQCPRCGDPITNELGDNPICGACALASDLNAMALLARITELEKSAIVWHRFDIDDCNTYPECGMYLTLSIQERTEYREVDDESVYDVLWFELYSEEYWDKHNVTHWTRLPEPPEVKE